MPLTAKTQYHVMCNFNQDDADKINKIMEVYKIQKNSQMIRFCIDQTYKELLRRLPTEP